MRRLWSKPKRAGLNTLKAEMDSHYKEAIVELVATLAPFAEYARSSDHITPEEWQTARVVFDKWTRKIDKKKGNTR